MSEEFGRRLRALRLEKGLQQGQLTGPGVSASYVSMLENGNREPTPRVVAHLAEILGVDPVVLAGSPARSALDEEQRLRLASAEMALALGDRPRAVAEFTELEPALGLSAAWGLARALEATGDLDAALHVLQRVTSEANDKGDAPLLVRSQIARSRCLAERGDDSEALEAAQSALKAVLNHELVGSDEHAQALSALIGRCYTLGDLLRADELSRELLHLVDGGSSWRARGSAYWNAAGVAEASGDLVTAVAYAERALALFSEGDDERAWARCAVACAWFWMRREDAAPHLEDVERLLSRAAGKLIDSGTELDLAYLETEQARCALLRGDPERAAALVERALERLGTAPRSETATALLVLAEALAVSDPAQAASVAERLEMTLLSLPYNRGAALSWRGLAEVHRRLGHADAAYRALEQALDANVITASPGGKVARTTSGTKRSAP